MKKAILILTIAIATLSACGHSEDDIRMEKETQKKEIRVSSLATYLQFAKGQGIINDQEEKKWIKESTEYLRTDEEFNYYFMGIKEIIRERNEEKFQAEKSLN